MIPIKANVASQTIAVTVMTSEKLTTPNSSATSAPPTAVVPIFNPLGCHITKTSVAKNTPIANAIIILQVLIEGIVS
jgi:hypothetical protein